MFSMCVWCYSSLVALVQQVKSNARKALQYEQKILNIKNTHIKTVAVDNCGYTNILIRPNSAALVGHYFN